MFVLAPFASLTLRMQGYAVSPGRGLTRRRGLPHRELSGVHAPVSDRALAVDENSLLSQTGRDHAPCIVYAGVLYLRAVCGEGE